MYSLVRIVMITGKSLKFAGPCIIIQFQ